MTRRTKAARILLTFLGGALAGGAATWFLYLLAAAINDAMEATR